MDTTQDSRRLADIVSRFDERMLSVLNASANSYRDERTLKRRAFYTCGYSGDRIEEPCHRSLQKAVWWMRYRERLTKSDAFLVAQRSSFSAFSRMFWTHGKRNTEWKTFKRAWRAAGRPQSDWSTRKSAPTRWRRRRPDEPLWSRKSDWLEVWTFVAANPGLSHRQLRVAQAGLTGRYVHLRLQAALEHLEALDLIEVSRKGQGRANRYSAHRAPVTSSYDRAFTNVPSNNRDPDRSSRGDSPGVQRWLDVLHGVVHEQPDLFSGLPGPDLTAGFAA